MNKDRYDEFAWIEQVARTADREPDWFDYLQDDVYTQVIKERLAARKARQATLVAPTLFKRLLGLFKRV